MSPSPAPPSKKAREYFERKFVKKCFKQDRIGRNAERFKLVSVFLFSRRSKYSSLYLLCHIWLNLSVAYILKAGFRGFRNPQIILNFPQRDCSWFQIFWHFAFLWCIVRLFINLRTFDAKFFALFVEAEKQNPQTLSLLECMLCCLF